MRSRAEALEESGLDRACSGPAKPYRGRHRAEAGRGRDHLKQRIVAERGYLNLQLNHEDVAEFDYRPGKCARAYRVIALRKNITEPAASRP